MENNGEEKMRLAGMALRNGVLMIGPTHWAAAVRTEDGTIKTASRKRLAFSGQIEKFPLFRGPIRLVEQFSILPAVRRALPESRFPIEAPSVMVASVGGSLLSHIVRRKRGPGITTELIGAGASLATLFATLRGGEVAQYHGAEHKSIGAYEQDIEARDASKEHPRCGTHLAVPMLLSTAFAAEGARLVMPRNPGMARMVGVAAGMAVATELGRSAFRKPKSPLSQVVAKVGTVLQSVGSTSEPNDDQLDVAEAALAELLRVEDAA